MRALALAAGLLASLPSLPAVARPDPVPDDVLAELDSLRSAWRDVVQPRLTTGWRVEYNRGEILLGQARLTRIRAAPENATGVVLTFLLAHEAWHSVQAARLKPADYEAMRASRMLECEADYMGGAWTYRRLAAKGLSDADLRMARYALETFTLPDWPANGDATYLPAVARRTAVMFGWNFAQHPELLSSAAGDEATGHEMCRKLSNDSDGSRGSIELRWTGEEITDPDLGRARRETLTIRNRSTRPITVNSLAFLQRRWITGTDATLPLIAAEVTRLIEDEITLSSYDGAVTRSRVFPYGVRETDFTLETLQSWPDMYTTRYSDVPLGQGAYCYEKLSRAGLDKGVLAKLATLALAADNDFLLVRGEGYEDDEFGRDYPLMPGLRGSEYDEISVGSGSAYADMTVFESETDDAKVQAEYERLKAIFRGICGADSVREKTAEAGPVEAQIVQFLPRLAVTLRLYLRRASYKPDEPIPDHAKGGDVSFRIERVGIGNR